MSGDRESRRELKLAVSQCSRAIAGVLQRRPLSSGDTIRFRLALAGVATHDRRQEREVRDLVSGSLIGGDAPATETVSVFAGFDR